MDDDDHHHPIDVVGTTDMDVGFVDPHDDDEDHDPQPPPRTRGRPRGSRNKPKQEQQQQQPLEHPHPHPHHYAAMDDGRYHPHPHHSFDSAGGGLDDSEVAEAAAAAAAAVPPAGLHHHGMSSSTSTGHHGHHGHQHQPLPPPSPLISPPQQPQQQHPATAAAAAAATGIEQPSTTNTSEQSQDQHEGEQSPQQQKKRRGKRQTAREIFSGDVPEDDVNKVKSILCTTTATAATANSATNIPVVIDPTTLLRYWPTGWTKKTYARPSTNGKTSDSYWYTPIRQYKLRSLPDVVLFLVALINHHPYQDNDTNDGSSNRNNSNNNDEDENENDGSNNDDDDRGDHEAKALLYTRQYGKSSSAAATAAASSSKSTGGAGGGTEVPSPSLPSLQIHRQRRRTGGGSSSNVSAAANKRRKVTSKQQILGSTISSPSAASASTASASATAALFYHGNHTGAASSVSIGPAVGATSSTTTTTSPLSDKRVKTERSAGRGRGRGRRGRPPGSGRGGAATTAGGADGGDLFTIKINQRKTKSGSKKDKNAPKGPMSAYVYFAADRRPQILLESPDIDPFKGIGQQLGQKWKQLDPETKKQYEYRAAQDRQRYATELNAYRETLRAKAMADAAAAAAGLLTSPPAADGDSPHPHNNNAMMMSLHGSGVNVSPLPSSKRDGRMITTTTADGQVLMAAPIKTTTTTTTKRGQHRKDPNAPKRALGAYNYFVRSQNKKIEQLVKAADPFDRQINDPTSYDYIGPEQLEKLKIGGGKVNFHEVGRFNGQRWKQITPEERAKYDEMAAQDSERYKREMESYDPEKSTEAAFVAAAAAAAAAGTSVWVDGIVVGQDGRRFHPATTTPITSRTKKAKDAPKQALSAYNYFFREERERIANIVTDPKNVAYNDPAHPESYITPEQLAVMYVDGKQTTEVGRFIGLRWKEIKNDKTKRAQYDELATEDMNRFNRELEEYRTRREDPNDNGGNAMDDATAAATAAAAAAVAAGHHHMVENGMMIHANHHHHHGDPATAAAVAAVNDIPNVAALAAAAASMQPDDTDEANGIVAAAVDALTQAHAQHLNV